MVLFEIKDNQNDFICGHHDKIDKVVYVNGIPMCPYCQLQFYLINGIEPKESIYKYTDWEIKEIRR